MIIKQWIDLTPETAGASALAIRIAQRILELDGMAIVREARQRDNNLDGFFAAIARDIDHELSCAGIKRPSECVACNKTFMLPLGCTDRNYCHECYGRNSQ
jgi:hypothetical protein